MNTYKLGNLIKKDLLNYFDNSEIHKQKFSFSYLRKLCETYVIQEYITNSYCCYGEDTPCWQDEDMSDIRFFYTGLSNTEINKKVYVGFKRFLNSKVIKKQFNISKRNIFIGENDKTIWFVVPLRDCYQEDIFFIFDKTKLVKEELQWNTKNS